MLIDEYAQSRAEEIARWAAAPPSLVARGFGRALGPASQAARALVPPAVLRQVLEGSQRVSRLQFHHRLPRPKAGASLAECDALARRVERVAMSLGAGVGAATGVGGAWALAADIPLLLTLALATIERTACCYGMADELEADTALAIGIFALSSANTVVEKQTALRALDARPGQLWEAAVRDGLERAAQRHVAKETAQLTLAQVARQLGPMLGQRKLGQVVPVLGSVVGSSVNALYVRDVARCAQQVFALRFLLSATPLRLQPPLRLAKTAESSAAIAED